MFSGFLPRSSSKMIKWLMRPKLGRIFKLQFWRCYDILFLDWCNKRPQFSSRIDGGDSLGTYTINPEFSHSKAFSFVAFILQFVTIGLVALGYYFTSVSYFLAVIFQCCVVYYLFLFFSSRYYRLHISPNIVTVWSGFNKPKRYSTSSIRWRIKRIPWYNTYFVCLYSIDRLPVAIVKPHWKNAPRLFRFPHCGSLTDMEKKYIDFLASMGLK